MTVFENFSNQSVEAPTAPPLQIEVSDSRAAQRPSAKASSDFDYRGIPGYVTGWGIGRERMPSINGGKERGEGKPYFRELPGVDLPENTAGALKAIESLEKSGNVPDYIRSMPRFRGWVAGADRNYAETERRVESRLTQMQPQLEWYRRDMLSAGRDFQLALGKLPAAERARVVDNLMAGEDVKKAAAGHPDVIKAHEGRQAVFEKYKPTFNAVRDLNIETHSAHLDRLYTRIICGQAMERAGDASSARRIFDQVRALQSENVHKSFFR